MITIGKRHNNYLITVDRQQLLDLYNRKQGKRINLTDFYKIQNNIQPCLLYDGMPRQHFTNSNPSEPQKILMLDTLKQYADIQPVIVNTSTKYLINEVYNVPVLAVDDKYTVYFRPLILDTIYKHHINTINPNQYLTIFTMTNNEIAYNLNILGNMFHHKVFSRYDDTREVINSFYDKYHNILLTGFTGYLISKVNEDIKEKISYAIEGINVLGLSKREIVLNLRNERLTDLIIPPNNIIDLGDIAGNILDKIKNKNTFMIEYNFNREFKKSIEFAYGLYGQDPPPYENCKISWEFTIDENFKAPNHAIDLDYCRKKLNTNIINKFITTNGLTLFEEYKNKSLSGELPKFGADISELEKFYKNVRHTDIEKYYYDILYIIENIAI